MLTAAVITLAMLAYLAHGVAASRGMRVGFLAVAVFLVAPPLAVAAWLARIAAAAWRDGADGQDAMRVAEICGLGLGASGCALGLWWLERAEESAARGGGLLGGLGALPLAGGALLVAFAIASWLLRRIHRRRLQAM